MPESEPEITPEELRCLLHDEDASAETVAVAETLGSRSTRDEVAHCESNEPSDVPAEALDFIEIATREFSDQLSASLTERLQISVATEPQSISRPAFAEFVGEMQLPTCFQVIQSPSLSSPIYWEWSSQLLFPLLDRLLGGGQLPPTIARRPLTSIEQRLVGSVSEQLLELFAAAWHPAIPLNPRLDRIEANPRTNISVDGQTPLIMTQLNIDLGSHQGPLRIAYHREAITNIADTLVTAGRRPRTHANVSIVLSDSFLDQNELLDLRVGDILTTEAGIADEAAVYLDNELVHHGVLGANGGHKAIRLS